MKIKLLSLGAAITAAAICTTTTLSFAQEVPVGSVSALNCLRGRVTVQDPKVVQVGPGRAMVKMKVTNNLSWPISQVFLQYSVTARSTGSVVKADPVSLSIPGALAPGGTKEIQTGFFGFQYMKEGVAGGAATGSADRWTYREIPASKAKADVFVMDAPDPNGNQLVHGSEIIGLGWTGRKSEQGCS